jgi:hypothetical protein
MKKTTKEKEKCNSKKGRVLRVPGGKTAPVTIASQESGGPEEVTAGFKAGKDLEA